jgi:hypothetical protein
MIAECYLVVQRTSTGFCNQKRVLANAVVLCRRTASFLIPQVTAQVIVRGFDETASVGRLPGEDARPPVRIRRTGSRMDEESCRGHR